MKKTAKYIYLVPNYTQSLFVWNIALKQGKWIATVKDFMNPRWNNGIYSSYSIESFISPTYKKVSRKEALAYVKMYEKT